MGHVKSFAEVEQALHALTTDADRRHVPHQEQDVTVTFLAADTDQDVPHTLRAATPENIRYTVVRKDRACDIYDNQAAAPRRVWTSTYITLRSTVAGATVVLRLSA